MQTSKITLNTKSISLASNKIDFFAISKKNIQLILF